MNMMNYDRKTLKERAKASLRGVQPRPWKVTLLYWLLVALIPGAINLVLQFLGNSGFFAYLQAMRTDPVGWSMQIQAMDADELLGYYKNIYMPLIGAGLLSTFVSILVRVFQLVMSYGYADYTLKLYRGEPTETRNIFSGFPLAGRAILTGIATFIFEFLWTLLAMVLGICATMVVGMTMAAFGDSSLVVVLGVLLLIAVWVAVILFSVFISYRYSLAPYFILTTDMGVMNAIQESKNAMRGNLGRRFMLDVSFFGWALVNGLIIMGVMAVGYFILIFVLGFAMAFQMAGPMQSLDPSYFESQAYASQAMGQLMGPMFAGIGILSVVSRIAALPLRLWLTAYRGSAYAGFFLAATGQDDAPTSASASDYIPPQPRDIWNNVPTPPSFTPVAPEVPTPAPEVSAPEVQPEQPSAPEKPEAPAEAVGSAEDASIEATPAETAASEEAERAEEAPSPEDTTLPGDEA